MSAAASHINSCEYTYVICQPAGGGFAIDSDPGTRTGIRASQRRALWLALAANGAYAVVAFAGSFLFGSLALLADAAHMLTDVAGLTIALLAAVLAERGPTAKHTYGLQRAETLAAQANGILILATAAFILYEAVSRIGERPEIVGAGLLIVATAGLLVNLGSAGLLARVRGRSLNVRAAYVHLLADAAGSIGAIVAGVAIVVWGATWVDTLASILIGVLVLWSAWGLLRDTTQVLLEAAPRSLDVREVQAALAAGDLIRSVHHLHVWNLASDHVALSAHLVMAGSPSVADCQACVRDLKSMLAERFQIAHATLEIETEPCKSPDEC